MAFEVISMTDSYPYLDSMLFIAGIATPSPIPINALTARRAGRPIWAATGVSAVARLHLRGRTGQDGDGGRDRGVIMFGFCHRGRSRGLHACLALSVGCNSPDDADAKNKLPSMSIRPDPPCHLMETIHVKERFVIMNANPCNQSNRHWHASPPRLSPLSHLCEEVAPKERRLHQADGRAAPSVLL